MDALRSAMVSLWRHQSSRDTDNFLGSGVFIGRATILTVRHIAQQCSPLFALAYSKNVADEVCRVACHPDPEIDVAVVWLRDHPMDAKIAPVDASLFSSGQGVQIAGYFEREYEAPSTAIVKQRVAEDRHYLIDLKQPQGYSGSPVEVDGRVRGVVCRHYKHSNTHRGCFIAVDQFADWLTQHVPGALVAPARPVAASVAGQREALQNLAKDKLKRSLSAKLFDKFPADSIEREGSVPLRLADALREDADDVGEAAVQGVLKLARDLGELLRDETVSLTPKEKEGIKGRLKEAMGWACRLCMGERAAGYVSLKDFAEEAVALDTPPGATLLFGQARHQSWVVTDQDGLRTVKDEHAILPRIELGEGADVKRSITKAVAASFSVTGQFTGEVDSKLENLLRGKAKGAAADGLARYVVLEASKGRAIDSEIRQWIRTTLGIGSIELTGFDAAQGLLTIDETLMLDRVTHLLDLFAEQEWN
jgi:hypothetical protein